MAGVSYSSANEIKEAVNLLRMKFETNRTKDLAWRRWQLKQLWWLVEENIDSICMALYLDLHRPRTESFEGDIAPLKEDIFGALQNLDKWTADRKVPGMTACMLKARVRKEPLGTALIISPWNYPLYLALGPMVYAIAAGCTVLLKPSEISQATEKLLVDLIPKYMDPTCIRVVTGGPDEMQSLLQHRFDQIFFTGSQKVARIVKKAAAENLTPVVLELGGQNLCFVAKDADLSQAAKTIARVKFTNAGQFCLCVNHVWADPEIAEQLVELLRYWMVQYLADGHDGYSRIINDSNFDRIVELLDKTKGDVVYGGHYDKKTRFIEPTVIDRVPVDDPLMSQELFGPIIPVLHGTPDQAIKHTSKDTPLATYIFSRNQHLIDHIIRNTRSGGVTVNNVFYHAFVPHAPFGGVGYSGMGGYHGEYGVDSFSNLRTIADVPWWFEKVVPRAYPPYNDEKADKYNCNKKVSFKKGETLEDQRKKSHWLSKTMSVGLTTSVVAAVLVRTGVLGRALEKIEKALR